MYQPDYFTITVSTVIGGRLYEMDFIEVGETFAECIIRLRDKIYPAFWGMYPFWAWIRLPLIKDPVFYRTL